MTLKIWNSTSNSIRSVVVIIVAFQAADTGSIPVGCIWKLDMTTVLGLFFLLLICIFQINFCRVAIVRQELTKESVQ